jgi:hypothetical protein
MKECDNSTRKIHISSNFILSISLLIMFGTLLLRPSLCCNTPLHFTTLRYTSPYFTQLHFTTLIDTSLPLIYTSLPFHLALCIYISYCSISPWNHSVSPKLIYLYYMNWRRFGIEGTMPYTRYCSGIPGALSKTTRNFSQDNWWHNKDSKQASPPYKTRAWPAPAV